MELLSLLEKIAEEDGIQKRVVGGVILDDCGRYLILSRKSDDFMGGIDEIPSGGVEPAESLIDALKREIKEETNLDANKASSYLGSFDYLSGSGKKSRQFNFLVEIKNVDNVILTEHSEYKWQTIDECNSNNKITTKTLATLNIANFNRLS